VTTDRELAQSLYQKKKKDSAFDTIGAMNKFYNQKQISSLALPLDFGKSIPQDLRADFIKKISANKGFVPNVNYYDPTKDEVVPNEKEAGFWQGVATNLEKTYNFASRLVSFGIVAAQPENSVWNLVTGNTDAIKKVWNESKNISPGQAAMNAFGNVLSPVVSALTAVEEANAKLMGGKSGGNVQKFIDDHALVASLNFDILDENQRLKAMGPDGGQNFGKIGSWMGDFVARFTIDPLILAGKGVKAYKALGYIVKGANQFEEIATKVAAGEKLGFREKKVAATWDSFLNKTDEFKSENDFYKVRAIRESSNPGILSSLLNDANKIEDKAARHAAKFDVIHMAMGNTDSYMRLAKNEKLLAAKVASLREEVDGAKWFGDAVDEAGNPVFETMSKGRTQEKVNELIKGHEKRIAEVHKKMSANGTLSPNKVPYVDSLSGMRQTFSNSQTFIDFRTTGIAGSVVRFHSGFFYKRNKNWINFEDNGSIQTVDNLLNRVVGVSNERELAYAAKVADLDNKIKSAVGPESAKKFKDKRKQLDAEFKKAHFTVERKNALFAKYANAINPDQRSIIYQNIEKELFNTVAAQFGYTEKQVAQAYAAFANTRTKMHNLIKERSYSGAVDTTTGAKLGAKIVAIPDTEGLTHLLPLPLNESQLLKEMATLDIDGMYKVLRRHNRAETGFGNITPIQSAYKYATQRKLEAQGLVDGIDQMLKFQVLARIGYPIRNVSEGSLRIMATVGPLTLIHAATAGSKNLALKGLGALGFRESLEFAQRHNLETEKHILQAVRDLSDDPDAIDLQIKEITEILAKGIKPNGKNGYGTIELLGHTAEDALGATPTQMKFLDEKFIKNQSTVFEETITRSRDRINSALQQTGDWVDIAGTEDGWADAYLRLVNRSIKGSKITSRILAGQSPKQIETYLKTDTEGIKIARSIGGARGGENVEEIVRLNFENVNHIFSADSAVSKEFMTIASKRNITADDIETYLGVDAAKYPTINGAQITSTNGTNGLVKIGSDFLETFYKYFGQIPEDTLTRSPLYVELYRRRMAASVKNAIDTFDGDTIPPRYMKDMTNKARQWARSEMRRNLYDLSERTDSAHSVKYFFPFFGAFSDVMEKWGKIVIDDPSVLAKMNTIYNSPDRNGMTEERNGITYINVPSEWVKHASFGKIEALQIPKASLNLIFQGGTWWNPGAGWFVQHFASQIVKDNPGMQANKIIEEILPYGPQDTSARDLLIQSSGLRKIVSIFNKSDPRRQQLTATILAEENVRFELGERNTRPSLDEINKRAIWVLGLEAATRLSLPFATNVRSPYQFYIDEFQRMRIENPDTASEVFYKTYGDTYYNMAITFSKNNTGIAGTESAFKEQKRLSDLISKNPEYGWFVVGPANGDAFNSAAYKAQYGTPIAPGSTTNSREKLDYIEVTDKIQADKGWLQYKTASAKIEAERIYAGFSSLNQKGAEYLAEKKAKLVELLGQANPQWYTSYININTGKIVSFLRYANDISSDPRISGRSDISTIKLYIAAREKTRMALANRGSSSILSDENMDLRIAWDAFVGKLINSDITFGDIYSRILEKDDLSKGI